MNAEQIEDRANKALGYLTDTDKLAADLKHEAEKAAAKYDSTIATIFLHEDGPIEVRKAKARTAREAEDARTSLLEATREYDAVANKRKSEALVVEWCRSLYANYRQGK